MRIPQFKSWKIGSIVAVAMALAMLASFVQQGPVLRRQPVASKPFLTAGVDRSPDALKSAPAGVGTKPPIVHLDLLVPTSPREIYAEQWISPPKGYHHGGYSGGRSLAGLGKMLQESEKEVEKAHALYEEALRKLELDRAELQLLKHASVHSPKVSVPFVP